MTRVAIIGGGASGVILAAHLARCRVRATLIEASGDFGRGVAYSTPDEAHLLNVRASAMSAFDDAPTHFSDWLQARRLGGPDAFAQRKIFGDYLAEVLSHAQSQAGTAVETIRDEAIACELHSNGQWNVELKHNAPVIADAVVLATGRKGCRRPAGCEAVPIIETWDHGALSNVPAGDDVLILGAGLSAVDVVLTLSRAPRTGTIWLLSRRGLTPRAHAPTPSSAQTEAAALPSALSDALHTFKREARAMTLRGEPWQLLFDRIRPQTPRLWRSLSADERRRFLRHARPWWDVHRHRAAPQVLAELERLTHSGRVRVVAGTLFAASLSEGSVEARYRARGDTEVSTLSVAHVVNSTGAEADIRRMDDPLWTKLLSDAFVEPHETGLGIAVDGSLRVIGRDGAPNPRLFAIGPLTQGEFWESTAVPEIRRQSAQLAKLLAEVSD